MDADGCLQPGNGIASTEHGELINGVVKGEWGYDGLVMSDWFATSSSAESANGGLDLVMPGPDTVWSERLLADVVAGRVSESVIDDHVRRLLVLAGRVGALGQRRSWPSAHPAPASRRRREQLRRLAASGMVVIKNDNAALRRNDRVALVGRHALDTIGQGGGSAQVRPPHVISVAQGLSAYYDDDRFTVVDGVETRKVLPTADPPWSRPGNGENGIRVGDAIAAARMGDVLPEGRLVTTFPGADHQGPAWSVEPGRGELPYTEGTFVGHRGWYAGDQDPAFWFGHGLGYTTWEYQHADITARTGPVIE